MTPDNKVILLGIDTPIGLTIIRELAAHGVRVYGIGRSARALGRFSRDLYRGFIRPPTAAQTIDFIARLAREEDIPFLMAISEPDIMMIHRHSAELGALKPLVPPPGPFSIVIDKERTLDIAQDIGIDTPVGTVIRSREEIDSQVKSIDYPVVLKWGNPIVNASRLADAGMHVRKAEYCYSPEELERALSRYTDIGAFPLVQNFCPGYGVGHMIFMYEDEPLLEFQHRRIAEWPPEGGFSVVCESLPSDNPLPPMSKSVELLRRIGWVGPAMVEYRYDPDTGRAVLMEVNGRFWGSLPLAFHAGANFAWLTYAVLGLKSVPEITAGKAGIQCRYVWPELKRLMRILFNPGDIQDRRLKLERMKEAIAFALRFGSPKSHYYVFTMRDPMPCLMDVSYALIRKLQGKLAGDPM